MNENRVVFALPLRRAPERVAVAKNARRAEAIAPTDGWARSSAQVRTWRRRIGSDAIEPSSERSFGRESCTGGRSPR